MQKLKINIKRGFIMISVNKSHILLLLSLIVLFNAEAFAVGEAGAQFLKIGVGAKACAMGEAFVGLADDPSAIYWNPAGLTQMNSAEILVMQNFWLLDMSYQYFAFALPTHYGDFGAAVAFSSSGKIPKYEDFHQVGDYKAYDASGTIAYANKFSKGFSFGISAKIIHQKIEEEDANGMAVDFGLLYEFKFIKGMNIGFAVQNLGPGIKFIEEDPLPLNIKGGISYKIGSLTFTSDFNMPKDNDLRFNIGGEFLIKNILALRGGYNSANSYTAGIGLILRTVSVDYSYVPFKEIDDTHRISVSLKFK